MDRDRARWLRVQELFLEAVELSAMERGGFLDDRCAGDRDLRDEVERMLRYDSAAADGIAGSIDRAARRARGDGEGA